MTVMIDPQIMIPVLNSSRIIRGVSRPVLPGDVRKEKNIDAILRSSASEALLPQVNRKAQAEVRQG